MDRTIDIETSYFYRGLAAFSVIVSHYAKWYMENGSYGIIAQLMSTIGRYGVAIFLFFSGYGLVMSVHKRNRIDKGFLLRRFGTVYIPYLMIKAIDEIITYGKIRNLMKLFFALDNWYIATIIIFYIMFYLLYRYLYKYRIKFLFLGILVYSLLAFGLRLNEAWYLSNICFLMGVLYSEFILNKEEDGFHITLRKILLFTELSRKMLYIFATLFVFLYLLYLYLALREMSFYLIVKIIISIVFVNLVLQMIGQLKIREFNIVKYSGVISLELYLLHRLCLGLSSNWFAIDNRICNMILGCVITFFVSGAFNRLYSVATKTLKRILVL